MELVRLCLIVATVRLSLAGYEPIYGVESQIPYNNGSYILFPREPQISEIDYQFFFSELNFNAINGRLISGAADRLYLFDLELNPLTNYSWSADTATQDTCINSNSNPNYVCRNHIRVYKVFPSNDSLLLTCGTQSEENPQCRSLTINGDSFREEASGLVSISNGAVVSNYPEFSNFGEFLESDSDDQRYFSASFRSGDPSFLLSFQNITSNPLQVTPLFTDLDNDNWLKAPVTFVDYYRADYPVVDPATELQHYQFYFIFLRESPVGPSTSAIYSRVVRICRNDPGLNSAGANHFTTFMKARIFCEREVPPGREFIGSLDFQYNEINSIAFNEEAGRYIENEAWNKRMYGAFTGASIGPRGTAICIYRADNSNTPNNHAGGFNRGVFDVFRESIQNPASTSTSIENPYVECIPGGRSAADSQLVDITRDIAQIGQNPLLILNITVTKMVIDSVCVVRSGDQTECLNQDVLFLGTDNGKILKVVFATSSGNDFDPVIAEEIQLDDDNVVNRLSIKEDSSNTRYLYASTFSRIYRLPLERCSRFQDDCSACIGSRDPYCVWNTTSIQCEPNPLNAVNDATGTVQNELKQNIHTGTVSNVCDRVEFNFNSSSYSISESENSVILTIVSSVTGTNANGLIEVITESGTATAGVDYMDTVQPVVFANGENTATVSISLLPDSIVEGENEQFTVRLRSTGVGLVTLTTPGVATVTIIDDDTVTIGFESSTVIAMEDEGYVNITLQKSGTTLVDSCIQLTTGDESAIGGIDYLSTTSELTFAPSQTAQTVIVPLINNDITELTRNFSALLTLLPMCAGVSVAMETRMVTTSIISDDFVSVQFNNSTYTLREDMTCAPVTILKFGSTTLDFTVQITSSTSGSADSDDFDATPRTVTLTATEAQSTVCIGITNDNILEDKESFTISLIASPTTSVQTGLQIGERDEAIIEILDDDSVTLSFDASSYSVSESTGYVEVTVMKQGQNQVNVTVTLSTTSTSTANAPGDYSAVQSQCLTFSSTDFELTYRILIVDDNVVENVESFQINLNQDNPSRVTLGTSSAIVNIMDDDNVFIVFSSDYTVNEVAGMESIQLIKFGISEIPLSVTISSVDGSANAGQDYQPLENIDVTFQPSDQQLSVAIMILNDTVFESTENFSIVMSTSSQQILTPSNVTTITITDDESVTIGFSNTQYTVLESTGSVSVSVEIDTAISVPLTVRVLALDGEATESDDYMLLNSTITFIPAGGATQDVTISLVDDSVLELPETFSLELQLVDNNERVLLDQNRATISIDDDDSVTLSFDASIYSVSESTGYVEVTVMKQGQNQVNVTVTLSTTSTSTANAPGDYSAVQSQCLTFSSTDFELTYRILIVDDNVVENMESFQINLNQDNPSRVTLGTSSAIVNIMDDDNVFIVFSSDYTVNEVAGMESIQLIKFGVSDVPLSVTISSVDGSANAGQDYQPLENIDVTFQPSDQQLSVAIMILNDTVFESTENFSIVMSTSSQQILSPSNVTTITITDDESVTIGFSNTQYTVLESTGSVSISVEIDTAISVPLTVRVLALDGEATESDDYMLLNSTITFIPAGGATQQDVTISLVDDSVLELLETFSLELQLVENNERVLLDQNRATISIDDDDSVTLSFDASSYSVSESTGYVEVTVMKQGQNQVNVTVTLSTTSTSTANAPGDYSAVQSQCLTFSPTDFELTYRILIVDDNVVENMESFQINLNQDNPSRVTLGTSSAIVNIMDDDSVSIEFVSDYTVSEVNGGQTIQLIKFGISDVPLSVTISSNDGSANAGQDYQPLENIDVTFQPSDQQLSVAIMIVNDTVFESTENFSIVMSTSSQQILIPSNVTAITITDDESVTIGFSNTQYTVLESTGSVSVSVEIDTAISVPLTVRVLALDGEATDVIFAPGESLQQNISLQIDRDNLLNGNSLLLRLRGEDDYEMVTVNPDFAIVSLTMEDSTSTIPSTVMSTAEDTSSNGIVNELTTSSSSLPPNVGGLGDDSADKLFGSFQTALAVLVVLVVIIIIVLAALIIMVGCMIKKYRREKTFRSRSQSPDVLPLSQAMSIHNKYYREDSTQNAASTPMSFKPSATGDHSDSPGSVKIDLAISSIEQRDTTTEKCSGSDETAAAKITSNNSQVTDDSGNTLGNNSNGQEKVTRL